MATTTQKRKVPGDNITTVKPLDKHKQETLRLSCLDTLHDFGKSSEYRSKILGLIDERLKENIGVFFVGSEEVKGTFIKELEKTKASGFEHAEYDNIKEKETKENSIKNSIIGLENEDIITTTGTETSRTNPKYVIDRGSKTSCDTKNIKYTFASWFDNAGCNKDSDVVNIENEISILKANGELLMLDSIEGRLEKLGKVIIMKINKNVIETETFDSLRPEVKKYSEVIFEYTSYPRGFKDKYNKLFAEIQGLPSDSTSTFTHEEKSMILMDLKRSGDSLQINSTEESNFFVTGDYMAAAIGLHKHKNVVMTYMGDKRKLPEQEHRDKKADVFAFNEDILKTVPKTDVLANKILKLEKNIEKIKSEKDSLTNRFEQQKAILQKNRKGIGGQNQRSRAGFDKLITTLEATYEKEGASLEAKLTKLKADLVKLLEERRQKRKREQEQEQEQSQEQSQKSQPAQKRLRPLNDNLNMSQQEGGGDEGNSALFEAISELFLSQHNKYYNNDIKDEIENAAIVEEVLFNFTNYGDYVDIFDPIMSLQGLLCMRYVLGIHLENNVNIDINYDNIDINYDNIDIICADIKKWGDKGLLEKLYKRVVYLHYSFLNQHIDYDIDNNISLNKTGEYFGKMNYTLVKDIMPEFEDILSYTIISYERIKNTSETFKQNVSVDVRNFQEIIIVLDELKNENSLDSSIPTAQTTSTIPTILQGNMDTLTEKIGEEEVISHTALL